MISLRIFMLAAGLGVLASAHAENDDSLQVGLRACAALDDAAERLACFDAISRGSAGDAGDGAEAGEAAGRPQPAAASPDRPASAPEAPAAGTATRPLGDDVGREQLGDEDDSERSSYTAQLTRCEETGPSRRTVFFLANGQIWRQSNTKRLRLSDCNAEIEITKDFFGFKMIIPGQNRTIRVRRLR